MPDAADVRPIERFLLQAPAELALTFSTVETKNKDLRLPIGLVGIPDFLTRFARAQIGADRGPAQPSMPAQPRVPAQLTVSKRWRRG